MSVALRIPKSKVQLQLQLQTLPRFRPPPHHPPLPLTRPFRLSPKPYLPNKYNGHFLTTGTSSQRTLPHNGHFLTTGTSSQRALPHNGHFLTTDTSLQRALLTRALPHNGHFLTTDTSIQHQHRVQGPRLQRKFLASDPLSRVFEWADADAELDPTTLMLTPAGASGAGLSLKADGARTLAELDLGKMALLQVGVSAA